METKTFCVVSAATDECYYMAQDHIKSWLEEFDIDKEAFKKRFGVDYDVLYNCADAIADDFLDNFDADIAENDQFDCLIQGYINRLKDAN